MATQKKSTKKKTKKKSAPGSIPSRQDILDYLKNNDGKTARRDLARAFGVKGADRSRLRALLKEMDASGDIDLEGGKRILRADALPAVAPIDILSVDDDGDLICMPAGWRGDDEPPMIRIGAGKAAKQTPPPGVGDRVLARLTHVGDDGYEASIIKQIGKGAHRFLAVYRESRRGGVAEPVERRARNNFAIDAGDEMKAKDGDLIWIEVKPSRGYGPQKARVRHIEGHIDDTHAFSTIALANHGIPTEFPDAVIKEAEAQKLPSLGQRTDLRTMPLLTIDPADAKDHDDAVFALPDDDETNPGGWRVTVAIADVSYFVREGSALDREALRRGNSVYLPDRVVPMLPERLSNDLCSLRENEDRPCLAVEMTLDSGGRKIRHHFMRALMRSHAKLAYEDAQAIEDGGRAPDVVRDAVKHLFSAYRARLNERAKRAPLDLDLPERKVILNDKGEVDRVVVRERFDAHKVIEEFMILANVAAAETLERARIEQIYRVHDQPDPEKLEAVREYLATLDYKLVKGGSVRPGNFNQLLKIAEARDEKSLISEIVLRSQQQAIYDTDNVGHFGLNLPRYAHFTSPIRRYADLTVHRALVRAGNLGDGAQTDKEAAALPEISEQISDLERRAMAAEREATDRYLSGFLAKREGATFQGRIRGVTKFGLFVSLDETGADGFIPMRTIGAERYRFDEKQHAIIGERSRGVYQLGQHVDVRLLEAAPVRGGLLFEMLSDPLPGKAARKRGASDKDHAGGPRSKSPKTQKRGKKKADGKSAKKRRSKANAKPRRD